MPEMLELGKLLGKIKEAKATKVLVAVPIISENDNNDNNDQKK